MKKLLITLFTLCSLPLMAAQQHHDQHQHNHGHQHSAEKSSNAGAKASCSSNTVNAVVNGLVCDFCALALEKVFLAHEAVASINVDLDNAMVNIELNEGKTLDDNTLETMITNSGYNLVSTSKGCSNG